MPTFPRSRWYLFLFFTLHSTVSFSQENPPSPYGKITPKDFTLPQSHLIDSSTKAVIISDVGEIGFEGNVNSNWVHYVFHHKMRIKILKRQAFDLATIEVQLRGRGFGADKLDSVQASTYTLESGQVREQKLDLKDVFRDSISKYTVEAKFTLPGLQEGCIIEYAYKVTSFHYNNLPYWNFQHHDYPCLYNKFETAIPNMLGYLTLRHGQHAFAIDRSVKDRELYVMAYVKVTAEVTRHTWVMVNIPPFVSEPYLEHPCNYMDAIEFYLLQTYNGQNISGNINWTAANADLLNDEQFGVAISPDNIGSLDRAVEKISPGNNSYMVDARRIYAYIRDNFVCEPDDDIYVSSNLYHVNKIKKGSVEDINMLLIAMLRQKKINASPVVLSTKSYGVNPAGYPVMQKMNYLICMIKMAGDTVFLDASQPKLGFGRLPLDCYNGHARIISDHDSGSIFLNPDNIKEQRSTTVFITNDEKVKGQLNGSVEIVPGLFKSYEIRNVIREKGKKDFFGHIQEEETQDIQIENPEIDSLANPDEPVEIKFNFTVKTDPAQDLLYFYPIVTSPFKENPFTAADRKYPVEMSYPTDEFYVLKMEIPEGYAVDELPKSVKVAYNGNEGFFEYLIQADGINVQMRSRIKLNKANFPPEDYNSLRDFFAYVVKKQTEQIVFKKKK